MERILPCIMLSVVMASISHAANFAPTPMKISSPGIIHYDFNGKTLSIPVTVTGVDGSGSFLIFTKNQGASIGEVTNGFLGWHHVNNIDTCLYFSPFIQLTKGANAFVWDGKGEGGAAVPPGDYTYYIWAYDNVNMRVQVSKYTWFRNWTFRTILTHDIAGYPLSNPIWYTGDNNKTKSPDPVNHTLEKWVIGGDPADSTLLETTRFKGWALAGHVSFDPKDRKYYFIDTLKESGVKYTAKWEWAPNGVSIAQTAWGDNGMFSYTGAWPAGLNCGPGAVSDGKDYLFVANNDIMIGKESQLIYLDVNDGSEIKRLDLSEWWVDANEGDVTVGGQYCGGPTAVSLRNNLMGLGSHSTCVNQLINPYYEEEKNAVLWTNANGDYTGDHNFEPNSPRKWVCNDYNVGPYKYNVSLEKNLFMAFPCTDMGAVSFGLYAPDGTGMGYLALAGETAFGKTGIEFIDYDSPYDGIYTTSNIGRTYAGNDVTPWYVAFDSIKGVITSQTRICEVTPGTFSIRQNTPNPFNSNTTISFTLAKGAGTTVEVFNTAGQKVDSVLNAYLNAGAHSVTWNAFDRSAGLYFCTIRSGGVSKTMKMMLAK